MRKRLNEIFPHNHIRREAYNHKTACTIVHCTLLIVTKYNVEEAVNFVPDEKSSAIISHYWSNRLTIHVKCFHFSRTGQFYSCKHILNIELRGEWNFLF